MVTTKEYKTELNRILNIGEEIAVSYSNEIDENELKIIVEKLIKIYEYLLNDDETREKAFRIVCNLGKKYDEILDLIIDGAKRYNENQKIEDADPYNPNSYDVLSNIGIRNEKIIQYLTETVKVEAGIPRYEAIRSLCRVNDSLADEFLRKLISGSMSKSIRSLDQYELQTIAQIKSQEFVRTHRR